MERGSTCRLNPTWYLVSQHFGLRGRQENYNSRNEHFKFAFAKNENGCTYVMFVDSNSTKMRIYPIKLQGRMVIPRMVASSGEKCAQLTFLKNLSAADQAKAMKVHGLKIVKTNFADEHFELVFSFQVHDHLSFHGYPQLSQMNSPLYLYLHVIVGCKRFIRHFHASFVNKIKRFLTPFRLVSMCILLIKKSLMRSEF